MPEGAMPEGKRQVIVIGNEKGGSGKSTTAAHLIVGLLRAGLDVASIDLDIDQGTLSRYLENRRDYAAARGMRLPQPGCIPPPSNMATAASGDWLQRTIESAGDVDAIVIDTPGSASALGRAAHSFADVILTPMNDSFVDFDVLARIDPETYAIGGPSRYAAMIFEQRKIRAARDGASIDWIIMRNRLSALDAISKRQLAALLQALAERVGFRLFDGFGERVIFRELFPRGLTVLDLKESGVNGKGGMTISQLTARQEVRSLVDTVLSGAVKWD
ncbi:MAG: division plane positioning ATPase MipZ [Rhodospirillales bacterium]